MTNAVIYARYSSDKQTEQSIEGQLRVCTEYANRMGYTVVGEYIDRAITGRSDDRPDFQRMIDDAKTGRYQYVIVYKLDRFSRNRLHSSIYKSKLKKHGVRVLSATEPLSDSPESVLLEAMLEGHAEYFSLDLAQKVKRGMRESALKGASVGGIIPYGYKIGADKQLHIDEYEAQAVKLIYDMYADGESKVDIAAELNRQGYKTRKGNDFSTKSFYAILKNTKYIGQYHYDGQVTAECPRIVCDDVFERVQAKIEKNKRAPAAKRKHEYMLSGKLFCGYCGAAMTGMSGKSRNGNSHHYYACSNRRKNKNCSKKHEEQFYLDWYITEQTQLWLQSADISALAKTVVEIYNRDMGASAYDSAKVRLTEVNRKIDNIVDRIADTGAKALVRKLEELEAQKADIDEEIAGLSISASVKITQAEVERWIAQHKFGDPLDDVYRRKVIDRLINAVFLYDDKVTIYYNVKDTKQVSYIEHIGAEEAHEDDSEVFAFGQPWGANHNQRQTQVYIACSAFGITFRRG